MPVDDNILHAAVIQMVARTPDDRGDHVAKVLPIDEPIRHLPIVGHSPGADGDAAAISESSCRPDRQPAQVAMASCQRHAVVTCLRLTKGHLEPQ